MIYADTPLLCLPVKRGALCSQFNSLRKRHADFQWLYAATPVSYGFPGVVCCCSSSLRISGICFHAHS